jgi:hypothetical protein
MKAKLKTHLRHFREERGQSIVLLAFAFIGLVGMLGLALDLGLVYIERIALKRSIDAAVLAGVIELPLEEDAGRRAIEYFTLNDYDLSESVVYFQGCIRDRSSGNVVNKTEADEYVFIGPQGMTLAQARDDATIRNIFWIDTLSYQGDDAGTLQTCNDSTQLYGTANKLRVWGEVKVDMNFMRIVPPFLTFVSVGEEGVAQNIDNLDVAVVIDRSGSMSYDPVCIGCWQRTETAAAHETDTPRWFGYYNYPENGVTYPLGSNDGDLTNGGWGHPAISGNNSVCDPSTSVNNQYYVNNGDRYLIMEAELYSRNNSVVYTDLRQGGKGHWALQRNGLGSTTVDGNTAKGAYMGHYPKYTYYSTSAPYGFHYYLQHAQDGDAPRLEYDFTFPDAGNWSSTAYIWVRVRYGGGDNSGLGDNVAYWTVTSDATANNPLAMDVPGYNPHNVKAVQQMPTFGGGWRWVRLQNPVTVNGSLTYRLYFYAGSSDFYFDRLVVTERTANSLPSALNTQAATANSARRGACDPCNPIYGENIGASGSGAEYTIDDCTFFNYTQPVDHRLDPLFADGVQPMRSSKEAIKLFVTRLDPEKDQVGIVSYSQRYYSYWTTVDKTELQCLRKTGSKTTCAAPAISYTQVLKDIEDIATGGSTNTGAGMKAGLEILGVTPTGYTAAAAGSGNCGGSNCARGAAAQRIMILMTDGVPNASPGGSCSNGPNVNAEALAAGASNNNAHKCPLYFAQEASRRGVTVYVIGLGYGVNGPYLEQVAQLGGGQYFFSASGGDLNLIFAEILNNIFVRLVK